MFLTFFKLDFCFELLYSQNTITFGGENLEKYYFLDLKESVIGKQVHLSNLGGKKRVRSGAAPHLLTHKYQFSSHNTTQLYSYINYMLTI